MAGTSRKVDAVLRALITNDTPGPNSFICRWCPVCREPIADDDEWTELHDADRGRVYLAHTACLP